MGYESPHFTIERTDGAFSIRFYPFFKTVVMPESSWNGYSGFNDLFGYISGNNKQGNTMKMTVPVINQVSEKKLTMEFVIPEKFYENTPEPSSSYLQLKTYTNLRLGVIKFRGNPTPEFIMHQREQLLLWLEKQHEQTHPLYFVARYNAPFMPGIFKTNEVWIMLGNLDTTHKNEVDDIES
jgi:hypothetical protein